MVIGICSLEFHLPGCRSLKEKRMILNRFRDRLRKRLNVAVAEVEHQDLRQRAGIAVVSVSSSQVVIDRAFQAVLREAEDRVDGELLRYETEYL